MPEPLFLDYCSFVEVLPSRHVNPLIVFYFFWIVSTIPLPWISKVLESTCQISAKRPAEILIGIVLSNFCINLGVNNIKSFYPWLWDVFHLFRSSWISFQSICFILLLLNLFLHVSFFLILLSVELFSSFHCGCLLVYRIDFYILTLYSATLLNSCILIAF